tara:strand:- start:103 stop:306 length:204 start_codon:yes stop_codon:yes gene_type:complete
MKKYNNEKIERVYPIVRDKKLLKSLYDLDKTTTNIIAEIDQRYAADSIDIILSRSQTDTNTNNIPKK